MEDDAKVDPEHGRPEHYKQYSQENLQDSVKSSLSPSEAASAFGVPRQTIADHRNADPQHADHRR
jgi:hypothetical protein